MPDKEHVCGPNCVDMPGFAGAHLEIRVDFYGKPITCEPPKLIEGPYPLVPADRKDD